MTSKCPVSGDCTLKRRITLHPCDHCKRDWHWHGTYFWGGCYWILKADSTPRRDQNGKAYIELEMFKRAPALPQGQVLDFFHRLSLLALLHVHHVKHLFRK